MLSKIDIKMLHACTEQLFAAKIVAIRIIDGARAKLIEGSYLILPEWRSVKF